MATTTAPINEQEAEALRLSLAEFDRKQAEERAVQMREFLAPVRALVDSPEFKGVEEQARTLLPAYATTDAIDVHLRHMPGFMARLRQAVDAMTPADPAAEPAPTATT